MWSIAFTFMTLQLITVHATIDNGKIPKSCLDYLKSGSHENGEYSVAGEDGETITVYCDFTSEPGSAWTLIISWALEYNEVQELKKKSLVVDAPVNEKTPNWNIYRMSKKQMAQIKAQSTHWRATCSFDQVGVDYQDYVRGSIKDFDILSFVGYQECKKTEYINIRGHVGIKKTVPFWQENDKWILCTESSYTTASTGCTYDALAGSVPNEDNFGYYGTTNPAFRCTSGPSSTTQYWFGGYL